MSGHVGRKAIYTSCHRCHRPVLSGLDDETLAVDVTVDAHPFTDPKDEGIALTAGLATFDVEGGPGKYIIYRRHVHHYGANYPAHRQHRCDLPLPLSALPALPRYPQTKENADGYYEPPF